MADVEARQRLRSSSSSSLIVSHTRLSTIGDRAFPVAAARVWNSLPDLVTSAPSVAVFRSRLKTHLFNISYPTPCDCTVPAQWRLVAFGHYNRSCLLTYYLPLLSGNDAHTSATAAATCQSEWHCVWFSVYVHAGTCDNQFCSPFWKYATIFLCISKQLNVCCVMTALYFNVQLSWLRSWTTLLLTFPLSCEVTVC